MGKRTSPYPERIAWTWDRLIEQVRAICVVDEVSGCWIWPRWSNERGYGRLQVDGKVWYVHRAVLRAKTGIVRSHGRHSCDNPPCTNPDHLSWGTQGDNMADAVDRGRVRHGDAHYSRANPSLVLRGSDNGSAKLTAIQVEAIRARYAAGAISQRLLGEEYGVCQRQISRIVRGERWAPTSAT